jgi:hypothetical protein
MITTQNKTKSIEIDSVDHHLLHRKSYFRNLNLDLKKKENNLIY